MGEICPPHREPPAMPNHPVTCLCDACQRDGTGDFAMREAFAVLRTDHDGRAFDLYTWLVEVRSRDPSARSDGHRRGDA